MSVPPSTPLARPKRSEQRKAERFRRSRGQRNSFNKTPAPWKKRVAIGVASLVALFVLLVGGVYWYAHWRFSQIHRVKVAGLAQPKPGQPFDILLVGSDSRQFVDNSGEAGSFGSASSVGGQRSDVIIIARIVPATRSVKLLSIPRDTFVDIPGNSSVSGLNRINAAYDSGPSLLVQTITSSFHIPISYYTEVNFPGFAGMVNALGGVQLDFPDPVKDAYSGLNIAKTGCQIIHGGQALALVRSRHLYYYQDGGWYYDGLSDFSRIQRQDAFFRAIVSKLKSATTDPFALNSFLGAATKYLSVDSSLSEGEIISLTRIFRGFTSEELATQTLPTSPYTTSAGADVLLPAPQQDDQVITNFLNFGTKSATLASTTAAVTGTISATLTASDSSITPVTSIDGASSLPSGAPIDYNNQAEPWNPTPCNA